MKADHFKSMPNNDGLSLPIKVAAEAASHIRSISESEFQQYFENLYHEHVDSLMKFAFFRLSDKEKSTDAVQDIFINYFSFLKKVRENLDKEVPDLNHRAFLFKSLRNSIIDQYRSKKSYSLDSLFEEGFDLRSEEDVTAGSDTSLTHAHVLTKIKNLKPHHQELLFMRYIEDMSVADIAIALGERENTISVQIHRIIESLKKQV